MKSVIKSAAVAAVLAIGTVGASTSASAWGWGPWNDSGWGNGWGNGAGNGSYSKNFGANNDGRANGAGNGYGYQGNGYG